MFNAHSITTGTKILPLILSNGDPVVVDVVFDHLIVYEVISGPYAGQRGTQSELRELCGEVEVLDWFSAVSCETGRVLLRVGDGYRSSSELVV
jgi:hypothetical protein